MKLWKKNILRLIVVVLIVLIPLIFVKGEYGGADGQAETVITVIDDTYVPWASVLFEPASGEIESLLFALQAAIGAGIIGFGFGRLSAKHKPSEKTDGNR